MTNNFFAFVTIMLVFPLYFYYFVNVMVGWKTRKCALPFHTTVFCFAFIYWKYSAVNAVTGIYANLNLKNCRGSMPPELLSSLEHLRRSNFLLVPTPFKSHAIRFWNSFYIISLVRDPAVFFKIFWIRPW